MDDLSHSYRENDWGQSQIHVHRPLAHIALYPTVKGWVAAPKLGQWANEAAGSDPDSCR
jgi:hypothetical protein